MSASLFYIPKPKEPEPEMLPDEVRYKIQKQWEHLPYRERLELSFEDAHLRGWLEGLIDCGIDGAEELYAALREHRALLLWLDS